MKIARGDLDGFGNGGDVDHLFLARHLGDRQTDRRGQSADDDVDTFLGDHFLGRCGGGGRIEFRIARHRYELAAHDTAGGVDFLDRQIMAAHGWAAIDGAAARDGIEHANLDFRRDGAAQPRQQCDGQHQGAGHDRSGSRTRLVPRFRIADSPFHQLASL